MDYEQIKKKLLDFPEEKRKEAIAYCMEQTRHIKWIPNPGPQTDCLQSEADVTLYGGAGGGGKSDALVGLAMTEHRRSLIMRRQYTDLSALTDRAIEINGTRDGFNGSLPPRLKTADNRLIDFGAARDVGDEDHWRGQAHDLLGIDEAAQFAEKQIRFLMGWVRSTEEGQRCRVVLASNPPLAEEGAWLISMFAPWLDPTHANPAKPGELRYFLTDEEGSEREVDGPGPHVVGGKDVMAMSRTFIPAKVKDNPFLAGGEYERQLDALPEPLRSSLRDGNFRLGVRDHDLQLIPVDWIRQAQERWTPHPPKGVPMCAMGVDIAAGGEDYTVIACRHDGWYAPLKAIPGRDTVYGSDVAGQIIRKRRDQAEVIIDMGGGYGSATFEHLKANGINCIGFKGSHKSTKRTMDRKLGFYNKRAEAAWKFREALDPSQPNGSPIALPPDHVLVSDLSSLRLKGLDLKGIQLETADNLKKRLGRSPDRGTAVIMAWSEGQRALTHGALWARNEMGGEPLRPRVVLGYNSARKAARR